MDGLDRQPRGSVGHPPLTRNPTNLADLGQEIADRTRSDPFQAIWILSER